jgi:hypothetical protein
LDLCCSYTHTGIFRSKSQCVRNVCLTTKQTLGFESPTHSPQDHENFLAPVQLRDINAWNMLYFNVLYFNTSMSEYVRSLNLTAVDWISVSAVEDVSNTVENSSDESSAVTSMASVVTSIASAVAAPASAVASAVTASNPSALSIWKGRDRVSLIRHVVCKDNGSQNK